VSLIARGFNRRAMAALALLILLLGTAPAIAAPVSAVDDQGRKLTLARPARRIVSLAPNVTEMLFAVGAGPRVVGVTQFCDFPEAAKEKPKIGNFSNPDLEAVAAARPDLVVAAHGNSLDGIAALRRLGLSVFVTHPRTTTGVIRNMETLGRLAGQERPARRVAAELRGRLARLERRLAGRSRRRALIVIWPDPLTVVGGLSYLNDAIRCAGGVNGAEAIREAYPKVDPERLITLAPEALIYPGADTARLASLARRPGVAETPAGRAKRVHAVTADWLLRAGPRLVAGIEEMARRLHPEAFRASRQEGSGGGLSPRRPRSRSRASSRAASSAPSGGGGGTSR
jgi:ABC-type Fe3+-hydroxamate transport system substrate-binding protein